MLAILGFRKSIYSAEYCQSQSLEKHNYSTKSSRFRSLEKRILENLVNLSDLEKCNISIRHNLKIWTLEKRNYSTESR